MRSPARAVLRSAAPDDAEAIYSLKVQAFAQSSLPYSIYRSPKTVSHLRDLTTRARNAGSFLRIKVVDDGSRILGYYSAVPFEGCFFLSYVAVEQSARGAGLGNKLLADFEAEARAMDFSSTALDVFVSNHAIPEWYSRHGYIHQAHQYHARVDLRRLPATAKRVVWHDADWLRALEDEERQGFAKLPVNCAGLDLELGLIDACAAKLLRWSNIWLEDVAGAIAVTLGDRRSELILSGPDEPPAAWPYLSRDRALRLRKVLHQDSK